MTTFFYFLHVITRNNDEQIGHVFIQSDVVIPDKEYNNEMPKQVQHDSLLCCHSEGVLATEESHNIFCFTLEGEPKSVISKGVKYPRDMDCYVTS